MMLDKLTQRAKNVLLTVSETKDFFNTIDVLKVLDLISHEAGLGFLIISTYPKIAIKTNKKIPLTDFIEQAFLEAFELKHPYVGTEHLLLSLLKLSERLDDYKTIYKKILASGTYPQVPKKSSSSSKRTPILDAFGIDYTLLFDEGLSAKPIEREELADFISILLKERKANPLLVGETGVGRASLVKLLASKIAAFEVPSLLANTKIVEFDLNGFLGAVLGREGLEAGFTALHDEIYASGKVILFIKDIHLVLFPSGGGAVPPFALSILKSMLLYSGIQIIASTSSQAYQRFLSEDEEFLNSFSVVKVKELDKKATLLILEQKAIEFEKFHSTKISYKLLEEAYTIAERHIKSKRFPQKAVDLLDKACSLSLININMLPSRFKDMKKRKSVLNTMLKKAITQRNFNDALIFKKKIEKMNLELSEVKPTLKKVDLDAKYLALAVSLELDVPIGKLSLSEENLYSHLEKKLSERIIGQEKAINALSTALLRSRLGLKTTKRPIGNFLFLGPTGVGKTELAKVLAELVFGQNSLIKLDMSDFSEKHTVSRLVGAPPGYVGFNEGGDLTEKIAKNPYSVVLFDEIEKAHPDVLNILLQIMDDGLLVDAKGKSFDFSHAIVILTSNLGSELINKEDLGYSVKNNFSPKDKFTKIESKLLANLKEILRPELLNRLDDTVVFNKLSKVDIMVITKLMLNDVSKGLLDKDFSISFDINAKKLLVQEGYSEEYGARSMRRKIERLVVDELAKTILSGKLTSPAKISVTVEQNKLKFNIGRAY